MTDETQEQQNEQTPPIDESVFGASEETSREPEATEEQYEEEEPKGPNLLQKLVSWCKNNKRMTLLISVASILVICALLPATRYAVAGLALKKDVQFLILDEKTKIPVSDVTVTVGDKKATTNAEGKAKLTSLPVGNAYVLASKKYYEDKGHGFVVGLSGETTIEFNLQPTGRSVPILVIDKLTGQGLKGAKVSALGSVAETDKNGEANIVLPADKQTTEGEIKLEGYHSSKAEIKIDSFAVQANTFELVPEGKVYFLSKRTGRINVMSANLDGSGVKVIIKGTGKEIDNDTILIASKDWQHLALKSRRSGSQPKLYLVDVENRELIEIDGVNSGVIKILGWINNDLVYSYKRTDIEFWEPKQTALKTYDSNNFTVTILDETEANGDPYTYARQSIESPQLIDQEVIYIKNWYGDAAMLANKRMGVYSFKLGDQDEKLIKDFPITTTSHSALDIFTSAPNQVVIRHQGDNTRYFRYQSGRASSIRKPSNKSLDSPKKYISSSGERTLWDEQKGGSIVVYIGDNNGENGKQLKLDPGFKAFGWYGDNLALVSKSDSELYIVPVEVEHKPIKVTDYHKPAETGYSLF